MGSVRGEIPVTTMRSGVLTYTTNPKTNPINRYLCLYYSGSDGRGGMVLPKTTIGYLNRLL